MTHTYYVMADTPRQSPLSAPEVMQTKTKKAGRSLKAAGGTVENQEMQRRRSQHADAAQQRVGFKRTREEQEMQGVPQKEKQDSRRKKAKTERGGTQTGQPQSVSIMVSFQCTSLITHIASLGSPPMAPADKVTRPPVCLLYTQVVRVR